MEQTKRPIREISNFLIHQVIRSTRQTHLDILRDMLDRCLLNRYVDDPAVANEYSRVNIAILKKQTQLKPVDMVIEKPQTN